MKIKIIAYLLFLIETLLFLSCGNRQVILCSPDGNKCLTIVDKINIRQNYFEPPGKTNYVKLDISKVDLETEGIFICWQNESGKIEVISPNTIILDQNFNKDLYQFDIQLREYESGTADFQYYHKEGCLEYNMLSNSIFPINHAIIK